MAVTPENSVKNPIDLIDLLNKIWKKKRTIFLGTVIFGVLGLIISFVTPVKYIAGSTFVPQVSEEMTPSSLGGLAALAGINLSSAAGGSEIPPNLYPKILYSTPFLMDLLEKEVYYDSQNISYKEYLQGQKKGILGTVGQGIASLVDSIVGMLIDSPDSNDSTLTSGPYQISDDEFDLLENLESSIFIETNEKQGFISISVKERDPMVAAQIAQLIESSLQQKVIDFKVENARIVLEFTEQQLELKKIEYYALQDSLAKFDDSNKNLSSSIIRNNRIRLASEYELAGTIYKELATQKEQAALQIEKDTPIFLVIDPVMVPNRKSEPKIFTTAVLFAVLGLILSLSFVLFRDSISNIQSRIKAN